MKQEEEESEEEEMLQEAVDELETTPGVYLEKIADGMLRVGTADPHGVGDDDANYNTRFAVRARPTFSVA